jgi:hypothetical protein
MRIVLLRSNLVGYGKRRLTHPTFDFARVNAWAIKGCSASSRAEKRPDNHQQIELPRRHLLTLLRVRTPSARMRPRCTFAAALPGGWT